MTTIRTLCLSLSLIAGVAAADDRSLPEGVWPPLHWSDPSAEAPTAARGNHAMVSTANPWATDAALRALEAGGTVVDAAVAAQFVLNVTEPQSSGIGGGCFMLLLPPGETVPIVIDGREAAPSDVDETLFLEEDGTPTPYYPERITGGKPVGVPGTLAALWHAHRKHGRLTWPQLIEPAVTLAESGFLVSRRLHNVIREEQARLEPFEASRAVFLTEAGDPLPIGSRLVQSDLAETFRLIARHGPSVFYEGEIGADVVRTVREAGVRPGTMDEADLAAYRAIEREAVHTRYRDHDVYGVGPPSSGGTTLIEMLNILSGFDLSKLEPGSADALHLILEAGKLAFADRNRYVGDSDFVDVPVETLVSPAFAARRRARIDRNEAMPMPVAPAPLEARGETTHLSIADAHGGLLAMTTTIEANFGSGMVVAGRGFLLNNELSDFDARPTEDGRARANRVEPGKRPRSSMSPTIVMKDGMPRLALGSPGGSRIIGITLNVLVNVVDWEMDVQEAINFPRAFNRGRSVSELELLFFRPRALADLTGRDGVVDALRRLGHEVAEPAKGVRAVGGVHAVAVRPDPSSPTGRRLTGGADPRREGIALGF